MLPVELKKLKNFIGWKMIGDKKMPMNIYTGNVGSSTDVLCRGSYEQAKAAVQTYGFTGIGFCFEEPWIGIDLDHCIVNGVLNEFSQGIMRQTRSYTEYSPSGTGIHIYAKGVLEKAVKTPAIEIYQTGRFFTVTERRIGTITTVSTIGHEVLRAITPREETTTRVRDSETSWLSQKLSEIKEGNRNNSFAAIAGFFRDKGFFKEDIFRILKPIALEASFDLQELDSVCRSIGRYKPSVQIESNETDSFLDFINDTNEINWLIPGVLADNTINIIAGLQESRKSWLLIDLAVAFATGTKWLGTIQVPKKRVLLIDQERPKAELQRRLRALIAARGIEPQELQGQMIPKAGTTYRMNLEQSFEGFSKYIAKERPDIVLVDSLKTFQNADITNNQSMQQVFENLKHLRNTYNVTFIILHHENKGAYLRNREGHEITAETIAGASSINEVPEGIFISVNHGPDSSILHHVKNSYGLKQSPIAFKVTDLKEDKSQISLEVI